MKRFKRILATAVAAISACSLFAFTACDKDDEKGGAVGGATVGGATVGGEWLFEATNKGTSTREYFHVSDAEAYETQNVTENISYSASIKDATDLSKAVADITYTSSYTSVEDGEEPKVDNFEQKIYLRHGEAESLKGPQIFTSAMYQGAEKVYFLGDIMPLVEIYNFDNNLNIADTLVSALEALGSVGGVVTKKNGVITIDYVSNYYNAMTALGNEINTIQSTTTVGAILGYNSVKGILNPVLSLLSPQQVKNVIKTFGTMIPDALSEVVTAVLAVQPNANSNGHDFLIKALSDETVAEKLAKFLNPEAQAPYKKAADYTLADIGDLLDTSNVVGFVKDFVSSLYAGTTPTLAKLSINYGGVNEKPIYHNLTLTKAVAKITENNGEVTKVELDVAGEEESQTYSEYTDEIAHNLREDVQIKATLTKSDVQIADISEKQVEQDLYDPQDDTPYTIYLNLSEYSFDTVRVDVTFKNGQIKNVQKNASDTSQAAVSWSEADKVLELAGGFKINFKFDEREGFVLDYSGNRITVGNQSAVPMSRYKATIAQILSGEKGTKVTNSD